MTTQKFTCPPQFASGSGTFSDNLVGFQVLNGGGLTQGNFEFTTAIREKTNRNFSFGNFSDPVSLDTMGISSVLQSKAIFQSNFKVYPNFDLSEITNFVLYGSMVKRISVSIEVILSKFPAAIEMDYMDVNLYTGVTAYNILYDSIQGETSFELNVSRLMNPFDVDFSVNATRNLMLREVQVSPLRNMTNEYTRYSLYYGGIGYDVTGIVPTSDTKTGVLKLYVSGNPFSGQSYVFDRIIVRPNDYEVNRIFKDEFDEVENFLLNRKVSPKYTAAFKVPKENSDGTFSIGYDLVRWPMYGEWNIDIVSKSFTSYLEKLNGISYNFDIYITNLVSRFLTTDSLKEFDTPDQKMEKMLQIYGRSFDETRKFIIGLAFMNSVNYTVKNDIPSQLLKNLAQTLGWSTNMSPVTNDDFLSSVFGQKNKNASQFSGLPEESTPDELNYQYYRNLILNSAYLFKSKGTRKSIEILMRLIGAPDVLVEFNEYVYVADQRINLDEFDEQFYQISGGTYLQEFPTLEEGNTFSIFGNLYTGFTIQSVIEDVNITREEYPVNDEGYPDFSYENSDFYFQSGSGWFEQTPKHRSPEEVDLTNSVFTGENPNYQTVLTPYTYGQDYLDRFRKFPYMDLGFNLTPQVDNNKSWVDYEIGLRSNLDAGFNANYYVTDDRLVLNVKNIDLFMNPSQGLLYDVWYMSRKYNYPIPNEGLSYITPTYCNPYPNTSYVDKSVDWTNIDPKPKRQTFFEFAQTFWKNMINVRNRQFSTNGKTGGYPTLESIYWKYLESQSIEGVPNDNFTYRTMIDYVTGMGDYWIRLVEQMIPASTIWNSGIKYENSIFHRQKFVWRRQEGCQVIPSPCNPCKLVSNIYTYDCNIQTVECGKYPWYESSLINSFSGVLGYVLNNYMVSNGYTLNDCILNTLVTEWFVDIMIDEIVVVHLPFFNGIGYLDPLLSSPQTSDWDSALITALNEIKTYGYDYYFTTDETVVVYNSICSISDSGINFKLNVGINFKISCS